MARKPPETPKARTSKSGAPQGAAEPRKAALLRCLVQLARKQARDRRRSAARRLTAAEIAGLLGSADAIDTAHARALEQAVVALPPRSRAILLAVLENTPRRTVARRFGLSVRAVDNELQRALEQGLGHLQRPPARGPKR